MSFGCSLNRGPRKVRDFLGRGGGAATSTSLASSLSQATDDEGAVAIHYGVPRKCVDQEWQKDLLRFLPKGQGDIKCQQVYSSLFL